MTKWKHILVVCNYELKKYRIGGMDRFFRAYNEELIQRGYKVSWIFTGIGRPDFHLGMDINLSGIYTVEDYTLNWLKKHQTVDIVITHFVAISTPFFKELKKLGVGYNIAVDHNPRPINGFSLKKRWGNRLKGLLYSRYIDSFAGVSKYTGDALVNDFGARIKGRTKVVYNGIDTSIYTKRRVLEGRSHFVVSSHLRESKGIQDLITAVSLLPKEVKNQIKIDIFGEGPMEAALKKLVQKYNLENVFHFKGSTSELPVILHHYSFLLQPTYMECFSLSILESLAANVPVITTPVGGNKEIIKDGENGFLFPAGDSGALKELLLGVILGRKRIVKDVSLEVQIKFNIKEMVKGHLQLLPKL